MFHPEKPSRLCSCVEILLPDNNPPPSNKRLKSLDDAIWCIHNRYIYIYIYIYIDMYMEYLLIMRGRG